MKVALVVPPFDYLRRLYGLVRSKSFQNGLPVGPLTIAAVLRDAGCAVEIVDAPALGLEEAAVVDRLRALRPDVVGVTANTLLWPSAASLATAVKRRMPGVRVIVGGAHPSEFPEHALATGAVDAAVIGEGEETALEALARWERGEGLAGVRGVAWRDGDEARVEAPRAPTWNLDKTPLPAYDLVDLNAYSYPPLRTRRAPALYMEVSRGCAYARCEYCTSALGLKRRYRVQSPEVAAERAAACRREFGAREIVYVDDDFVASEDWIGRFCDALRACGRPVTWSCYLRASQVNVDILRTMAGAGCHQILIGMEVLDDALLASVDKDLTVAVAARAVRDAHAAGIGVIGLFIVGLPESGPDSVDRTIAHAHAMNLDLAVFSVFRPSPGSPVYESLGWTPEDYVRCFKLGREAVYTPSGYRDRAEVERAYARAHRAFYMSPRFVASALGRMARDPRVARQFAGASLRLAEQFVRDMPGYPALRGRALALRRASGRP